MVRVSIQNCARVPWDKGWVLCGTPGWLEHAIGPRHGWLAVPHPPLDALEHAVLEFAAGDVEAGLLEAEEACSKVAGMLEGSFFGVVLNNGVRGRRINDEIEDRDRTYHAWGRFPGTMCVWHLLVPLTPGPHLEWELFVGNCDMTTHELIQQIQNVRLEVVRPYAVVVDYAIARGGEMVDHLLGEETWLRHGQGLAWKGRFINLAEFKAPGAAHGPVTAISLEWSSAWGPFGTLPWAHPELDTAASAAALALKFYRQIDTPGGPMRLWDYGLARTPSQAGDQQDFGTTKLAPLFGHLPGNPFHLYELGPSILQEASRPSYFFEPNASPLNPHRHPNWWTWGLTTHYDARISPDRLGKIENPGIPPNQFWPKDFAHLSSLNLAGYAIATGSPLARFLCRHEVTAAVRFDRGFGLGQERAFGRWAQTMAWHYLATGDERMFPAFEDVLRDSAWEELDEAIAKGWDVKVFGHDRDARYLGGKYEHWNPWHQGLLIQGIYALLSTFQTDDEVFALAMRRIKALAETHIRYGWQRLDGRWWVAYAVRWKENGEPLTQEEMDDPGQWAPSYGTAFNHWCWPAVKAALKLFENDGSTDSEFGISGMDLVLEKARAIDHWLHDEWATADPVGLRDRAVEWMSL